MPPKKRHIEENKDASSDLILRGEDAKALMANEYFRDVRKRVDEMVKEQILSLHPTATAKFAGLQERRQALIDLWNFIVNEADAGRKELAKAQGETVKTGRVA